MKILLIPISIVIGALILGGFYYFVELKKADNDTRQEDLRKNDLVQNQIKCKDAAEEYAKKEEEARQLYIFEDPRYIFSTILNTCVYWREASYYFGRNLQFMAVDNYIRDIYSNKVIYHLYQHFDAKGDVNDSRGTEEEYRVMVEQFFGPQE